MTNDAQLAAKKAELIAAFAEHRARIEAMTHSEYQAYKAARAARIESECEPKGYKLPKGEKR